jgi:glycosyltransferase involved in cell wall biosynthesis
MKISKIKDKNNYLVSIVMNCFNGEKYLKEAINSLLAQTYKNWELIFYDNCSTDKSKQIIKEYKDKRIYYFRSNKKHNLGLARKKALVKTKGDFISFLDTDDIWKRNKIQKQIKSFDNAKIGFSISNSIFFNKSKNKNFYSLNTKFKKKVFYKLVENYFISFDTVMIRWSYLKKLNHMFDERFNIIHDMDLLIRLSIICEMNYVPFSLSKWRMREESLSYNNFDSIIKEKKVLINKLNKLKKNDSKFNHSKKKYMDILYRQKILLLISQKKIFRTFGLIKKLRINLKNLVLVLIIFFPFKKYIFNNFFNLKY